MFESRTYRQIELMKLHDALHIRTYLCMIYSVLLSFVNQIMFNSYLSSVLDLGFAGFYFYLASVSSSGVLVQHIYHERDTLGLQSREWIIHFQKWYMGNESHSDNGGLNGEILKTPYSIFTCFALFLATSLVITGVSPSMFSYSTVSSLHHTLYLVLTMLILFTRYFLQYYIFILYHLTLDAVFLMAWDEKCHIQSALSFCNA